LSGFPEGRVFGGSPSLDFSQFQANGS